MIDIAISGLVKEFEVGKKILDGLTFQVDSGERVGLLGKNGCGKTTLLRILTGQLDWDEGEVVLAPDKRVGLISQIPVYPAGYTVEDVLDTAFRPLREMEEEMEQLAARMERGEDPALLRRYDQLTAAFEAGGGYDTDTRKNKVCSGLQIGPGMREQLFDRLSGGEKTRVNLGRLILEDTDILLLDEPTNHLDLKATEWLEEYLDKFKGTVLAVSHDRWFLDRVVDRVIEIQEGKAEFYSGNYSFYVVEKERRYQEKLKQYEKEQAKIQQLEKAAEQLRIWAYSGNDKIFKRAQSMEKRIERMRTTDRPTRERKMEVRFGEREFRGDEVLTIKGLSKSFGQRALFSGVDLEVVGGERIALLGDNGTGKSTLIKILMGEEGPDEGKIRMGPTVKIGYLPQIIHFDHPERSLLDTMLYELDCTAQTAVLYRDNDSALPLVDLLDRAGIPYRCRQMECLFFTNRVVRDLTDLIRFAREDFFCYTAFDENGRRLLRAILDEHRLYRLQQYLLREAHCPVTNEPVYLFPLELLAGFYQPPGERQYHVRPGLGWLFDFQMPAMERLCNTGAELIPLPGSLLAGLDRKEGERNGS